MLMVTTMIEARETGLVESSLRSDGPRRGRSFTPAEKLARLDACEQALASNDGGAYLRREGLYSWQIAEWRKLRDAGVLEGRRPGERVAKLTREQVEIARLTKELAEANKRLATTEAALDIMGKHTRSWGVSPRARTPTRRRAGTDEHVEPVA